MSPQKLKKLAHQNSELEELVARIQAFEKLDTEEAKTQLHGLKRKLRAKLVELGIAKKKTTLAG